MRVIVTRPEPDAGALKAKLEARGHETILAPVSRVRYLDALGKLGPADAVMLTSANAARAVAQLLPLGSPIFALPAYTVGAKTAQAARAAGFAKVTAAEGTVDALIAHIRDEAAGLKRWLYFSGDVVRHDPRREMEAMALALEHHVVYTADAAETLAPAAATALAGGAVDAVMFYSPRAVDLFADLVAAADLRHTLANLPAACLSAAVAARATAHGMVPAIVAPAPTSEALIAALEQALGRNSLGARDMADQPILDAPAPQKRWRWLPWGLLVLLLAFIAGVVAMPRLAPALAPYIPWFASDAAPGELEPRLAVLEERIGKSETQSASALAALNDRLDRLAVAVDTAPEPDGGAADNRARLDQLSAEVTALAARLEAIPTLPEVAPSAALEERLTAVAARLDRLEAISSADLRQALWALAVARIEDRIGAGGSFASSMALLQDATLSGEAAAARDRLAAMARDGVASTRRLQSDFADLIAPLLAAAQAPPEGGWWSRFKAWAGGLVTVRRVGEVAGDSAEARVARAEARLASGDLAAALAALDGLPQHSLAMPQVAAWLAAARARLAAEADIATLAAAIGAMAKASPDKGAG